MGLNQIYLKMPVWVQNCFCTAYGIRQHRSRFGGRFSEYLDMLEESQWWDLPRLKAYQLHQLQRMLKLAYDEVPFWKDRFDRNGIRPEDITSADELKNLPVLEKSELQDAGDRAYNPNYGDRHVVTSQTSGSTGSPLQLRHTYDCVQFQRALWWRHRRWYDIGFKCREASFGSKMIVSRSETKPPFWRTDVLNKRTIFSQYHLTEKNLSSYIDHIDSGEFECLSGFPSIIYLLADYLDMSGRVLGNKPKIVFAGSENVEEVQRHKIEKHLAPVTSHYGGAEYASLASQCPQGVYHIDMECGIIEIIPLANIDHEPGTVTGSVVVTGFKNDAMPLIRYNMSDCATLKPDYKCPCGRRSPVLTKIDGRSDSYVITTDGRKIGRISRAFMGHPWIRESQVIQQEIGSIAIKVVKRAQPSAGDIKKLTDNVHDMIGHGTIINIEYIKEIPRTAAGKFRAIISKVGDHQATTRRPPIDKR